MHTRTRSFGYTRRLSLLAIALASAAPLDGQVVARAQKRDSLSRDTSTFTFRVLRTGGQDSLLLRIESIGRRLDREPFGSADRVQLEADLSRLMSQLTEIAVGASNELRMRIGTVVGDAFSRAMIESGEAARQLRSAIPRGWIGIVAEGPRMYRRGENEVVRYFRYPSIVSVEPNSPAERAGILAGDTLVAYNQADVRDREINLSRVLIPDRPLAVTIRRDGDTREYNMVVAKAPEDFARTRIEINGPIPDSLVNGRLIFRGPPGAAAFGPRGVGMPGDGPAQRIVVAPSERVVPPGAFFISKLPFNGTRSMWGAQLSTIDEGLGRTLGVKSGVLVTAVAPATPASRSGLESGDIILRVDGRRLATVEELHRAAVEHDDHAVELQIQRAKKLRTIKVRWSM